MRRSSTILKTALVALVMAAFLGGPFIPAALAADDENGQAFTGRDEFGAGLTIPIAWGDADGDGLADLAVGNLAFPPFPPNELFLSNGDGTFTRREEFGAAFTFAVCWADIDNDGDQDLVTGNFGSPDGLFRNNGTGTFTALPGLGSSYTIAVAWADYDLDGDLDLAVGNGLLGIVQQNTLWVNDGSGSFTPVAAFGTGQTATIAWGDYDNDGDPDLAVGNGGFGFDGQNFLYVNNGDGTFTGVPAFGGGDTASVAWADATGDGLLDLAVGNWDAQQNYLYVNNGDGSFTARPAFGSRDTNTVVWGDVDLDGDLDLAVGNGDFETDDQNHLYLNNGLGTFKEVPEFGRGSTDSIAFADYDGDGDLDAAVGNEHSPTVNQLWVNNLDEDHYVRLELVGRFAEEGPGYSNRDAVGAVVALYRPGGLGRRSHLLGYQEVEAHGGFSSQNERALTFGLSSHLEVDVMILWPGSAGSSIAQCLRDVDEGKRLVVVESADPAFDCTMPAD